MVELKWLKSYKGSIIGKEFNAGEKSAENFVSQGYAEYIKDDVPEKINKKPKKCQPINEKQNTLDEFIIKTSFFKKNGFLFEQILTIKGSKFIQYNPDTEEIKIIDEYKINKTIYKPLQGQEVDEGHIKLPSNIEEYGADEELEESIKKFIRIWLDVSEEFLQYSVWEIKQSWIYDVLNTINYLRFLGDTGQGKSRALETIGFLYYKPIKTSGASTVAPIFRIINKWHGTLLLDEFDLKTSDESVDVIKLVNLGFEKNNPIMRCEQNNIDNIQFFDPYCPKLIASRKPFDDKATESRCFTETMIGTSRTDIPPTLDKDYYDEAQNLRNKLLLWRLRNYNKIKIEDYKNIDLGDIEPRIKQTHLGLLPLFAKDEKKLEFFKNYLQKLQTKIVTDRQDSFEGAIVRAFCDLVENGEKDIAPIDIIIIGQFVNPRNTTKLMNPISLAKWLKELGLEKREPRNVNGSAKNCIVFNDNQLKNLKKRYGIKL